MSKRGLNELTDEEIRKLAKGILVKKIAEREWVKEVDTNIYTRDK